MCNLIRVLLVEDSEDDLLLMLRELKKVDYDPIYKRVETKEDMCIAIKNQEWDVILCDYKMPQFNGVDALFAYQAIGKDIPFIIVSGTMSEDMAIAALKAGAHNYITKRNLHRLVPAIETELREKELRDNKRKEIEDIRQREECFETLFQYAPDAFFISDLNGNFIEYNLAGEKLIGWKKREIIDKDLVNLKIITPGDMLKITSTISKISSELTGSPETIEISLVRKDKEIIRVNVNFHLIKMKNKIIILEIMYEKTKK